MVDHLLTAKYLSGDKGTLFLGEGPLFHYTLRGITTLSNHGLKHGGKEHGSELQGSANLSPAISYEVNFLS